MCSSSNCENHPLDTIAQLGTKPSKKTALAREKNGLTPIQKRARSKYLSNKIVSELHKLDSPLKSSYGRSLSCCNEVTVENGVAKSKYCKNRWCLVCARIKTAVLIEKYKASLDTEIQNPYFVTLTIPNCTANFLKTRIDDMFKVFKKIIDKRKKQNQRGKAEKIKCVLKLECTYNAEEHTFHPHLHIIVSSKESAKYLQREWLQRFPKSKKKAQDIREANENSKIELFKYTTKLMSQIEEFEDEKRQNVGNIYIEAMDVMFRAISKRRTLRAYGFRLEISEDFGDEDLQAVTEVSATDGDYFYEKQANDWINTRTGEFLACFVLTSRELKFGNSIVANSGRQFLSKFLTQKDVLLLIEAYRFKPKLRAKYKRVETLVQALDLDKDKMFEFQCDIWEQVREMGFDDDDASILMKFDKGLDNFR